MNLHYKTATISYCLDLTAARGGSVEIGYFFVADMDGNGVVELVTDVDRIPRNESPIHNAFCSSLHAMLEEQMDCLLEKHGSCWSVDDLVSVLCWPMKGTLHVSSVSIIQSVEVESPSTGLDPSFVDVLSSEGKISIPILTGTKRTTRRVRFDGRKQG